MEKLSPFLAKVAEFIDAHSNDAALKKALDDGGNFNTVRLKSDASGLENTTLILRHGKTAGDPQQFYVLDDLKAKKGRWRDADQRASDVIVPLEHAVRKWRFYGTCVAPSNGALPNRRDCESYELIPRTRLRALHVHITSLKPVDQASLRERLQTTYSLQDHISMARRTTSGRVLPYADLRFLLDFARNTAGKKAKKADVKVAASIGDPGTRAVAVLEKLASEAGEQLVHERVWDSNGLSTPPPQLIARIFPHAVGLGVRPTLGLDRVLGESLLDRDAVNALSEKLSRAENGSLTLGHNERGMLLEARAVVSFSRHGIGTALAKIMTKSQTIITDAGETAELVSMIDGTAGVLNGAQFELQEAVRIIASAVELMHVARQYTERAVPLSDTGT
jgi:hypothetical protein